MVWILENVGILLILFILVMIEEMCQYGGPLCCTFELMCYRIYI